MGQEIYIRKPSIKGNYSDKNIETDDALEMFLQQIEMTLNTPTTSVLGSPRYGISLDYFLHTLNTDEAELKDIIRDQISKHCTLSAQFKYTIEVTFYNINNSDAMIIDIIVENDNLVRIVAN